MICCEIRMSKYLEESRKVISTEGGAGIIHHGSFGQ